MTVSISRAWAIVCRHLRQMMTDIPRLTTPFYWALIELLLIGFMGMWIDTSSNNLIALSLIAAAIGWSLIVRTCLEISWNMLEELWAHNLVNLFASPLTIGDWMLSAALFAAIISGALLMFLALCAYMLFGYNFFSVGWMLIPLLCNYYLSGLAMGFLTTSLLIYAGVRVTSYVFMISWLFAPLSGLYYNIDVMPTLVQYVAHLLPTYYGIDVLKTLVLTGNIIYWKLGMTFALNSVYLIATSMLFKHMFEKSKNQGLARLM